MRVALYERVSTEDQVRFGLSIDAQKAALDEWAADFTVVDHYTDLGVSARSPASKRPELQRMLRDIEQDKIDLVAFTKLDRFFRNIREYYKVVEVLEKHHVAWKAIHEDYETQTASGRLKVNVMLAVGQDEADRTSERIKAVFEDKRRKGLVPTGAVPLGVKIENGKYVPSEDAQKVRDIFDLFIATRSTGQTAEKTSYTSNGIRYLLRNRTYLVSGVVDERTWDTAQEILKSRSQRHQRTDRVYLFSGLIRCPHCGSVLTCVTVGEYVYYRCPNHMGKGSCPGCHVSERKLESFLLDNTIKKVRETNIRIREKQKKKPDISKLKNRADKLADLYLNDLISREKYETEYKCVQSQIAEAEKEPSAIDTVEVKTLLEAYNGLSRLAKKTFWTRLVKRVSVNDNSFDFDLFYT